MTDLTTPTRRHAEATAHRRALHLVMPYMDKFLDWNHRAARATATILSHVTLPDEKSEQRRRLADLTTEVEATYDEFRTQVAGHPPHSRIHDVDAAFERLIATLRQV